MARRKRKRRKTHEVVGQSVEFSFPADLKPPLDMGYSMLKYIARQRRYKRGFAAAMCKKMYGRVPTPALQRSLPAGKPNNWINCKVAEEISVWRNQKTGIDHDEVVQRRLAMQALKHQ